jgi:hypothetical protein
VLPPGTTLPAFLEVKTRDLPPGRFTSCCGALPACHFRAPAPLSAVVEAVAAPG